MRQPRAACTVIFDTPGGAAWNMAVDEALLDRAAKRNVASLRFYTWLQPTVSLGYFQRASDLAACNRLASLPSVRRMSGGGALLHDREITYSLALPASHPLVQRPDDLYQAVHQVWIEQFTSHGVATRLFGAASRESGALAPDGDPPLLCFRRRAPFDVVAAEASDVRRAAKLIGSAQRRRGGAVLQHGAVLLSASPHAPELPGVEDLAGRTFQQQPLAERCAARLLEELGLELDEAHDSLWPQAADRLAAEKYGCEDWTSRR